MSLDTTQEPQDQLSPDRAAVPFPRILERLGLVATSNQYLEIYLTSQLLSDQKIRNDPAEVMRRVISHSILIAIGDMVESKVVVSGPRSSDGKSLMQGEAVLEKMLLGDLRMGLIRARIVGLTGR